MARRKAKISTNKEINHKINNNNIPKKQAMIHIIFMILKEEIAVISFNELIQLFYPEKYKVDFKQS